MADNPITRKEKYLAKLTGSHTGNVPDPITRVEKYLYDLCQKGISGLTPEEIENAVNKYLKENPVQPGATTEQAQQINQNKTDIASLKTETGSLKEDISTKITKFYASSQGETHLADSDNGKIMDMMVYGKSEQKQYSGKNLFTFQDGSRIKNGITFEAKDGIITAKGTATKDYTSTFFQFDYPKDIFVIGETYTFSLNSNDENLKLYALYKENDATDYRILFSAITKTVTVQIPENVDLLIRCVVDINTTVNATATIQIEKGSEATPYEPYTGGIPSPNPDYPQEIKSVVNPTVKLSNEDGTQFKTVTLPYTLNAIPVSSGGNVTIGGQQYVSDYVDVERGKLVRMVEKAIALPTYVISQSAGNKNAFAIDFSNYAKAIKTATNVMGITCMSNKFESSNTVNTWNEPKNTIKQALFANKTQIVFITDVITIDDFKAILSTSETYVIYQCKPIEESIPNELAEKLKALQSRYPQTNILITSDELDGYTVFNYPISMENGWNYVKQQIGDTRDYIYDMDARTQDTDLQAAEAYVNSEYAVALTELEV